MTSFRVVFEVDGKPHAEASGTSDFDTPSKAVFAKLAAKCKAAIPDPREGKTAPSAPADKGGQK